MHAELDNTCTLYTGWKLLRVIAKACYRANPGLRKLRIASRVPKKIPLARRGAIAYHISFPTWIFEWDPGKWCPEVRVGSLMTASTGVCRVSFGALWAELKK